MGCFFGCFRIKEDSGSRSHLAAQSASTTTRVALASHNRLSSLLISGEDREASSRTNNENLLLGSPVSKSELEHKELKDEAMFLKSWGTLLETPAEIRKASKKFEDSQPCDGDEDFLKLHSWPITSIRELVFEKQPDQPPTTAKLCEESEENVGHSDNMLGSCIADDEKSGRGTCTERSGDGGIKQMNETPVVNKGGNHKSVRFECEAFGLSGSSSNDVGSRSSKRSEMASPCPTPVELSDDMQTPGTVFPTNFENIADDKKVRIRTQYVHSYTNHPGTNWSQREALMEEDNECDQIPNRLGDPAIELDPKLDMKKPPEPTEDDKDCNRFGSRRTVEDRPILGTVAAHWNEEDDHLSPKWWDGNGIPNSTNKYKEDQKVSWHATPFEDRLERALSQETCVSQRKPVIETAMSYEENEESDTGASGLSNLSHPKSLVSC